jgi:hypothetical protein
VGLKTSEDRKILEMRMRKNFGDVYLNLTDDQYAKAEKPDETHPCSPADTLNS